MWNRLLHGTWLAWSAGMLHDKLLIIGCGAVVGLCASSPALACSPSLCESPVRLFGPERIQVATNLIYFNVLVDDPGPLLLRTSAGEPIAASIQLLGDDRVFAPDAPLPDGTEAELVYTPRCRPIGPEPQEPQAVVYRFLAGIPGEYELRPADLELITQGLHYPRTPREESFVEVRYYTPEATGGAFHLMDNFATIDGLPIRLGTVEAGNPGLRIQSRCAPPNDMVVRDTCGTIISVPPGDHVLEVWSHVIGQTGMSERVRMTVDTSCNAGCSEPAPPDAAADGGAAPSEPEDASTGSPPTPSAAGSSAPEPDDAGADVRAMRIASAYESEVPVPGSCSAASVAKRTAPGWVMGACLSFLAAGLRRRLRSRVQRGAGAAA